MKPEEMIKALGKGIKPFAQTLCDSDRYPLKASTAGSGSSCQGAMAG